MSICPGVLATHSGASPAASAQDAKVCRASYMRRYRRPLFFITLAHTSLSLSWRIGLEHLQKLKERLARVDGKEREIVRAELAGEEEKEIIRVYVYQDVARFRNRGIEKVDIIDINIAPSKEGSIETEAYYDHAGSEESMVHIYLYAQNGECAHIYFNNPINGYRSINLGSDGSDSDAVSWLGGQSFGKIEF